MRGSVGSGARRAGAAWVALLGCAVLLAGLALQEPEGGDPEAFDPEGAAQVEEVLTPAGEVEEVLTPAGEMDEVLPPAGETDEVLPPREDPVDVTPLPSVDVSPPTATPTPEIVQPDSPGLPTAAPIATPGTPTPVPPVITTPGTRTPTSAPRGEPPAPPARVVIRAIAIGTVGLEWVDSSDNEQGYRIDVSGPTPRSQTFPPNTTEYNFGGLRTGTYCFKVVAFNQDGDSPAVEACIGVR